MGKSVITRRPTHDSFVTVAVSWRRLSWCSISSWVGLRDVSLY